MSGFKMCLLKVSFAVIGFNLNACDLRVIAVLYRASFSNGTNLVLDKKLKIVQVPDIPLNQGKLQTKELELTIFRPTMRGGR